MTRNMDNLTVQFDDAGRSATLSNGANSVEVLLFDATEIQRLQTIAARIYATKRRERAQRTRQ